MMHFFFFFFFFFFLSSELLFLIMYIMRSLKCYTSNQKWASTAVEKASNSRNRHLTINIQHPIPRTTTDNRTRHNNNPQPTTAIHATTKAKQQPPTATTDNRNHILCRQRHLLYISPIYSATLSVTILRVRRR
jgi:hypothetical protein